MNSMDHTFGIGGLIAKYLIGALGADEQQSLDAWLNADENNVQIFNRIIAQESLAAALIEMKQVNTELALTNVKTRIAADTGEKTTLKLWPRIAALSPIWKVAAAVAAITLGIWLYYTPRHPDAGQDPGLAYTNDVAPGKNTATLTLANGKTITLSDAKTGVIIDANSLMYDDGTAITSSLRGGTTKQSQQDRQDEIAASRSASRNDGMVRTLAVSTPRGGQYQVVLPDGSKVWLNAASSIKFPSSFAGLKQRGVELIGEAYFEIFKNKNQKFVVTTKSVNGMPGQQVEVLGTHFNINSYPDEEGIKTTLLEGSVRISSLFTSTARAELGSVSLRGRTEGEGSPSLREGTTKQPRGPSSTQIVNLLPGQQASLKGSSLQVATIDPTDALAWKNGLFVFNNEGLESVMRKISRWYNVDVYYAKGANTSEVFAGSINRFEKVSKILEMLEKAGDVKFKVEGRRITVQ